MTTPKSSPPVRPARASGGAANPALRAALLAAAMLAAAPAQACDGKPYSFDIATGQMVSGGGLAVQLDRVRLFDDVPDKYTISVKDDADLLADHVVLVQHDTLSFKTRCGIVTIGADRKSMFHRGTLSLNWSYF